jgi:predicted nucleic acid-binding protein
MPPVDVTIAAISIQNGASLLSKNAHFEEVAKVNRLMLYGR